MLIGSLPKDKKSYVFLKEDLISYNPEGGNKVT